MSDYIKKKIDELDIESLDDISIRINQRLANETVNTESIAKTDWVSLADDSEGIEEELKLWGKFSGLSTGFSNVDSITFGWEQGELIILGGTPGVGKSAFIITLLKNFASQGVLPALMTLELTRRQVQKRVGRVGGEGWREQAQSILVQKVQFIDRRQLKDLVDRAYDYGARVLVVDYLQMLKENSENEHREVSRIVRELKLIALHKNMIVIAISALNRGREDGGKLKLRDLHGSGAIEYYADQVMFLGKGFNEGEVEVYMAKNRSSKLIEEPVILMFDGGEFRE